MISLRWKEILNILIPFYRIKMLELTKDEQWKQKKFYIDPISDVLICSSATYSGLENRKKIVDDAIYFTALKKLNKYLIIEEKLDDYIYDMIENLYNAIEIFSIELINSIANKLIHTLNQYEQCVYYAEVLEVVRCILGFYNSDIYFLNKKEYDKFSIILDIFPDKLQRILIYIMFQYSIIHNRKQIKYLLRKQENSSFIWNKIAILEYNALHRFHAISSIGKCNDLLDEYLDNKIIWYSIQSIIMLYSMDIDGRDTDDLYEEIISRNLSKMPRIIIYNILLYLIIHGRYQIAIDYLHKYFLSQNLISLHCLSMLIFCRHMLEIYEPDKTIVVDNVKKCNKSEYNLYNLLLNMHTLTQGKLCNILEKTIIPNIQEYDVFSLLIIEKELIKLLDSKNYYKAYSIFRSEIYKNCKKKD